MEKKQDLKGIQISIAIKPVTRAGGAGVVVVVVVVVGGAPPGGQRLNIKYSNVAMLGLNNEVEYVSFLACCLLHSTSRALW